MPLDIHHLNEEINVNTARDLLESIQRANHRDNVGATRRNIVLLVLVTM